MSVVIAAYNAAHYIGDTLRSVLAQSCQDFEILVVDDGSTDGTAAAAADVGDPRVRVLTQGNAGPAAARNAAIAASSGEYIAILDADDLWHPEKLARQIAVLDARPELGLCFTHLAIVDSHGVPLRKTVEEYWFNGQLGGRRQVLPSLFSARNRLAHSSAMIRRRALDACGAYDPVYLAVEDFELWLRLLMAWEVEVIPAPLTIYRVHRANLTRTVAHSYRMLQLVVIIQRALQRLPIELLAPDLACEFETPRQRDEARARAHLMLASVLCDSGFAELVPAALEQLHLARELAPELTPREMFTELGVIRNVLLARNTVDTLSWDGVREWLGWLGSRVYIRVDGLSGQALTRRRLRRRHRADDARRLPPAR